MPTPKPIYVIYDFLKNAVLNFVIDPRSGDPSSPVDGQQWTETGANAHKRRRNGQTEVIPGNVQVAAPIVNTGDQSVPIFGISAATTSAAGSMSAADKTKLNAATNANTGSTIVARDSNGDFAARNITANQVTGLTSPTQASDAANKAYVDALIQGLVQKPTARVAVTTALPTNTYSNGSSGLGATLTASSNGALALLGVTLAPNDRVLVMGEATGANNGLYYVTQTGGAGAPWILTRDPQMDTANEYVGSFIPVGPGGSSNANTLWLLQQTGTITPGTTALSFTQLNSATSYSFTAPLSLSGGTVSLNLNARLVNNGGNLDLASGIVTAGAGTRVTADTYGRVTNLGPLGFAATIGNNSNTTFTVTHNLGTQDVIVQVRQAATPFGYVDFEAAAPTTNTVSITFNGYVPANNEFRVIIVPIQ